MQPEQQLQWKRSQAQTRLLSRKRKLAELFSVTALDAADDYTTKLKAFQDANDLECGRLFDENTLPPRVHVTRLQRKLQNNPPVLHSIDLAPTTQRQSSATKADSVLSPQPNSQFSDPTRSSPSPQHTRERGLRHKSPVEGRSVGSLSPKQPVEITRTPEKSQVDETTNDTALSDVHASSSTPRQKAVKAGIDSGLKSSNQEYRSRTSSPNGRQSLHVQEKRHRSRSPLVLATTTTDQHSSPASTEELVSSNTPIPAVGSPSTSPEDEKQSPNSNESIPGKPTESEKVDSSKRPETPDSTTLPENHDSSAPMQDVDMTEAPVMLEESAPGHEVADSVSPTEDATSLKPVVRLNTQTGNTSYFASQPNAGIVESPAPITAISNTPRRPALAHLGAETPKRATRISSGVLQKKSVSEILGEVPKSSLGHSESSMSFDVRDGVEASSSHVRNTEREQRDKQRSKLSTVVFTKPQKHNSSGDAADFSTENGKELAKATGQERDYLYTLFENKAYSMTRQGSISYLIQNAHKTLSTADHMIDYQLQAECRILKRLYQLQEKQRWPLRQYKRAQEAPRPTSHWDFVLDHAKWMRTDFREERKWKLAAAREFAECCAEWVHSSQEQRKLLQVRVKQLRHIDPESMQKDVEMDDDTGPVISSHPTPELMPSHEDESVTDELAEPKDFGGTVAPAAIFSLGASDFNFAVDRTPTFDKLLNELPLYEPTKIEPDLSQSKLAETLDARWRTDIVPVSKFATEKLNVKEYKPTVKRSRYDYEIETSPVRKTTPLPPQDENVALFMAENKHIRDRIHPGHSFRPPSEYPMPTQAFFETRSSSQWTQAEDDELRKLVKDYSYNWSLISSCLSPRSLYSSGADRRTPWECFERWIGLEGLPADMSKTPYFKTYSGRIEAAGRHVQAQIEEAQRRAGANVQIATRKRTTQPVRVERKRTQRHLAMLDAMRKLAKKRESALQKQQHQAELAAMRKVNEVNQPKAPFSKPSEFAALKIEREQKLAERQEIYRQQLIAHQRAAAQAQRTQNPQPNGMPNGVPQNANNMRVPPTAAGMPGVPNANLQVPNGHARLAPPMMGLPNGMQVPQGMAIPKNLAQAQAQMQANLARGVAASPEQMRMLQQATKAQQEQMMRQAQQQAQMGNHSSPLGPNAALTGNKGVTNPAYMAAALAMVNGVPSPSVPANGTSGSPRSQGSTGQALSSGHIPVLTQIANKIREQFPHMSDDEVQKHASQQIQAWQQQATTAAAGQVPKRPQPHNQAAVNAAMGAVNAAAHASNAAAAAAAAQYGQQGMMTNEQVQQYNQRMRMHQAQQHAARNSMPGQMPPGMVAGMANSPVMNMARPVSQHTNQGQLSRSATPRDQRSTSQSNVNGTGQGQQGSPRPGSAMQPS